MSPAKSHPIESKNLKVLVTGASGYVGGRLVSTLEELGLTVRCMARRPETINDRFCPTTEIVEGDVLQPTSLINALADIDTAYYLIHSMGARTSFERSELEGAQNFSRAAKAAGVKKIVYLGGLCCASEPQSAHMRSRVAVGEILRKSGIPTIEFRASIIIGSGSLSFELVRSLVERLPVMLTPKWVKTEAQPIAIEDVMLYLQAEVKKKRKVSQIYEIGGYDRVSYLELMKLYAKERGLQRIFIPVPVLTPYLSSLWLHLVTPVFSRVGRKLIASVCSPSTVTNYSARNDFDIQPMSIQRAITQAMQHTVQTSWADAISTVPTNSEVRENCSERGSVLRDSRREKSFAKPEAIYEALKCIGGKRGWYYANWLWKTRGLLDRLIGGIGILRGRRHDKDLRVGDVVDCWRVEALEPPSRLLLKAEMKLPGTGWLEFAIEDRGIETLVHQTATFEANSWVGKAYWYSLYPLHQLLFRGMLAKLIKEAESFSPLTGLSETTARDSDTLICTAADSHE